MEIKQNISLMEPATIYNNSIYNFFKQDDRFLIRGCLTDFKTLGLLMKIKPIDMVLSDVYDRENSIIDGIDFLRKLQCSYSNLKIIIQTDVNLPQFIMQVKPSAVIYKKQSLNDWTSISTNPTFFDNMAFDNRGMLNETEWEILLMLSKFKSINEISNILNINYNKVSRYKVSIAKKLGAKDSAHLKFILSEVSRIPVDYSTMS